MTGESTYLIKRVSDGKYVAPPGSDRSYTASIKQARKFSSRDAAAGELCVSSEIIVRLVDELGILT